MQSLLWDNTEMGLCPVNSGHLYAWVNQKKLLPYEHDMPFCPQHCPYQAQEKKYGKEAHEPMTPNTSAELEDKDIKIIQQVVGSILWYARLVDMMVLMALSTIASQ